MADTTPIEVSPEPRTEEFTERKLPDEPRSDVKIVTESGMILRERVIRTQHGKDVSFRFTYTRLDNDGNVMLDAYGNPIISDPHEVQPDAEGSTKVSANELADAIKLGRKVAVARAVDQFTGLEKLSDLFIGRL